MSDAMMDYRVVTNGGVLEGHDPQVVTAAFASLVKLEPEKAQLYFAGKPRVVQRRTDQRTAAKYQHAFKRIGVDSTVVRIAPAPGAPRRPHLQLVADNAQPDAEKSFEALVAETAEALATREQYNRKGAGRIRRALENITLLGIVVLLGAFVWRVGPQAFG